ncbi:MAG: hypothetical protein LLG44_05070 [Chloroflexi bacterium]|nr:hypothetical protein [Chloroflexota bacterium]
MGFLDKLRKAFTGDEPAKKADTAKSMGDPNGIMLYFRCNKCGSLVRVRVDRRNDLNSEDGPGYYVVRKDVMDSKCFQMMKAEIWLDVSYGIVQANVRGGSLITEEEYKAAQIPPTPAS